MTYDEAKIKLAGAIIDAGIHGARVLMPLNPLFDPIFMVKVAAEDGRECCMAMEQTSVERWPPSALADRIREAYDRFIAKGVKP